METTYGKKHYTDSPLTLVATHSGELDLGSLTEDIARKIGSSYVINDRFLNPDDSNNNSSYTLDFDTLLWDKKYCFGSEVKRVFYEDILQNNSNTSRKSIVIFLHGMPNRGRLGIDIGCGLLERELQAAHRPPGSTINNKRIYNLFSSLSNGLMLKRLRVGVGEINTSLSRETGVQYCHSRGYQATQIELNRYLRGRENFVFTANLLANALETLQ